MYHCLFIKYNKIINRKFNSSIDSELFYLADVGELCYVVMNSSRSYNITGPHDIKRQARGMNINRVAIEMPSDIITGSNSLFVREAVREG